MGRSVLLYGLSLAAACLTRHSNGKTLVLRVVQYERHALKATRCHRHPCRSVVPSLCRDATPHLVAYGLPVTIQHLAQRCRAYAHTLCSFVLAALLCAETFKAFRYLYLLFFCHVALFYLLFIQCLNAKISSSLPRRSRGCYVV